LIKDFFKQQIKFNDTEYSLMTRLNALPSSPGAYTDIIRRLNIPVIEEISDAENISIEHAIKEDAYQWAMSIIENKEMTTVLDDKKLEEYNKFLDEFFETNNITSFIVSEIKKILN